MRPSYVTAGEVIEPSVTCSSSELPIDFVDGNRNIKLLQSSLKYACTPATVVKGPPQGLLLFIFFRVHCCFWVCKKVVVVLKFFNSGPRIYQGCQLQNGGANLIIWPIFSRYCMKMKEIGPKRGCACTCRPLSPPVSNGTFTPAIFSTIART